MEGFLLKKHVSLVSLLFDFEYSERLRKEYRVELNPQELNEINQKVRECKSEVKMVDLLRNKNPSLYVTCLKAMGKEDELHALYDGVITP